MYKDVAKEGTFLHSYMQLLDPLETPRAYDFWGGIWMLSNTVGRRVRIPRPMAPVYLNTYVILCAEAGATRKSTAVRNATELLREAGMIDNAYVVTSSSNKAAMDDALSELTANGHDAHLCITVSELVSFLGKEVHAISTPGYLTDIYDCPSERLVQRASKDKRIANLYPTLLSASTPSWLVRAINPDVIEGGFTSRCLFIWEERPKRRVAWPEQSADYAIRKAESLDRLKAIRETAERITTRGITLTNTAKGQFGAWYERRKLVDDDAFVASFQAREDHHVLRLAGLLACNDLSFVINSFHLDHAIRIVDHVRQQATRIFSPKDTSTQRLAQGIEKLREVLITAPAGIGVTKTRLLFSTRNMLTTRELNYALDNMHDLGMIQVFRETTRGRTATIYMATDAMASRNAHEALIEKMKR